MTVYTAQCEIDSDDAITASRSENRVELEPSSRTEVYLAPAKARTFARGILALADEIDGGDVEAEAPKRAPQVGDRVRVVKDDMNGFRRGEFVGLVGTLTRVSSYAPEGNGFKVQFGDGFGRHGDKVNGTWNCTEVELVDEPAPEPALADWERDLLAGPSRSSRAKYVEEAKDLLSDKPAAVAHIIELAQWLAAGDE
ncbi:hypothetical protein [Streptomyces canus]|uniref:hypothetical protein n=1 Tax=Streptomyces canus TaxID=58343 RepID=UPI003864647B|nr:hypothetical protein OH824_35005 [Streptomyces canus]